MSLDTGEFEEKPICCFKNDKNVVNFEKYSKILKICTFLFPFRTKYFDLKKYRGVIFHDTEESCKI